MHLESILMLLGWPVAIILCWFAVRIALRFYEKKQAEVDNPEK